MVTDNYQLKTEDNKLIFRTSSFRAEKTSVLHSGVYTKEFSSMLFASAISILVYMISSVINSRSLIMRLIIVALIFVAAFIGAHKFIFKDSFLEAEFNRTDNSVNIVRSGLIARKVEKIPFAAIKSIELGSRKFIPENMDGIDFVQKISAQHGSAIPGLSKTEEFVTLSLKLTDASERIIFAARHDDKTYGDTKALLNEIHNFTEI